MNGDNRAPMPLAKFTQKEKKAEAGICPVR
jgi:hypothetical protein